MLASLLAPSSRERFTRIGFGLDGGQLVHESRMVYYRDPVPWRCDTPPRKNERKRPYVSQAEFDPLLVLSILAGFSPSPSQHLSGGSSLITTRISGENPRHSGLISE